MDAFAGLDEVAGCFCICLVIAFIAVAVSCCGLGAWLF